MAINPSNIEDNAEFCENGATAFEEWIRSVRQLNGFKDKIDWHYVAGRAVVKVIGSPKRARRDMEYFRHSCPARLHFVE